MVDKSIKWIMTFCIIMLMFVLFLNRSACAANHYILDGGTGNGTAWNNALDALPATLTRGDTYYIGDGTYPRYTFDDAVSGTDTIFVYKATVAAHGAETGWSNDYGDGVALFTGISTTGVLVIDTNNWVIDGISGSGNSGHGFKVAPTDTVNNSYLVRVRNGADSLKIAHIEAAQMGINKNLRGYCIYISHTTNAMVSYNINVSYCYLHDSPTTAISMGWARDCVFENNYLYHVSNNGTIHHEGFSTFFFDETFKDLRWIIRNNIFKDCAGTAFNTGFLVIKDGNVSNVQIYNNLFYSTNSDSFKVTNGVITNNTGVTNDSIFVYNNTFYNLAAGMNGTVGFSGGTNNVAINNLFYGCGTVKFLNIQTHDYNASQSATDSAGVETNNVVLTADPFVNSAGYDFALKSGSQAFDKGDSTNVTWTTDIGGNDRIQGANIDIGAYEMNTTPTPPTGITATVNLPGHSVFTFTDNSADEDGFQIIYNGVVIDSLAADTVTFSIDNEAPGTVCNVQVTAYKDAYISGATAVTYEKPRYRMGRIR